MSSTATYVDAFYTGKQAYREPVVSVNWPTQETKISNRGKNNWSI